MATFTLSQRDLEGILEDLDPIYRHIEDADEIDTVRNYAHTLRNVASQLQSLAHEYDEAADEAEREEEEEEEACSWCNRPFWEGGGRHDDTSECEECVSSDR